MVEITFPKEEKYMKFFEGVKDVDQKIMLKPYYIYEYEGKSIRSDRLFSLLIEDIKNDEFSVSLGEFIYRLIETRNPRHWRGDLQRCIDSIRWMDPILSEFKKTKYADGLEISIQLGKINDLH